MRDYTTQMDAAKRGIITPEMKTVAEKEYRSEEEIRDLVRKSGMEFVTAYDAFTKEEPGEHSERVYVIARESGKTIENESENQTENEKEMEK